MDIRFKKNPQINEIAVTVENHDKNDEVERLFTYLKDYEQSSNVLLIEKDRQVYKVPFMEILWIEVMGDYVSIHTNTLHLEIRKTLQAIASELPDKIFVRVSRNTLLNIKKIKKVENSFSGTMSATLLDDQVIHISRQYWKNMKKRILEND